MLAKHPIFYMKCVCLLTLLYLIYLFNNNIITTSIRKFQQPVSIPAALDLPENLLDQSVELPNANDVVEDSQTDILRKVREVTKCVDKPMVGKIQKRRDYWVLYNYVRAKRKHKCHESVTYTTHADYSFLDNLVPLLEKWRGPISIALHAPGTDFAATVDSIAYLRDCTSSLVREFVTFHIYFSNKHVPSKIPHAKEAMPRSFKCSQVPPYLNVSKEQMYKTQQNLFYPVNVGRNVARETAQTHFILPSDIELYPSLNIIPQFMEMIANNSGALLQKNPKVFPLNLFEVSADQQVPGNKTALKEMLANRTAIRFHQYICPECHRISNSEEWLKMNETKGLHVFHVGKRTGSTSHWEPIFIGTHSDPLYDERLSWEGKNDKMTHGYTLCLLDYNFLILDNAFLVHKPGIKLYNRDAKTVSLAGKTIYFINKVILPEIKNLYGVREGCKMW